MNKDFVSNCNCLMFHLIFPELYHHWGLYNHPGFKFQRLPTNLRKFYFRAKIPGPGSGKTWSALNHQGSHRLSQHPSSASQIQNSERIQKSWSGGWKNSDRILCVAVHRQNVANVSRFSFTSKNSIWQRRNSWK